MARNASFAFVAICFCVPECIMVCTTGAGSFPVSEHVNLQSIQVGANPVAAALQTYRHIPLHEKYNNKNTLVHNTYTRKWDHSLSMDEDRCRRDADEGVMDKDEDDMGMGWGHLCKECGLV